MTLASAPYTMRRFLRLIPRTILRTIVSRSDMKAAMSLFSAMLSFCCANRLVLVKPGQTRFAGMPAEGLKAFEGLGYRFAGEYSDEETYVFLKNGNVINL